MNGEAVERKEITADGKVSDIQFDYTPTKSCWVALRIFPTCHTNPVFVEVDGVGEEAFDRALFGSVEWVINAPFIAEMYERYVVDPKSVDASWQSFFGELTDEPAAVASAIS